MPGLRTVVMPKASHARPCASPKSFCRCEWNSISPGIAVRLLPSITVPVCAAARCAATDRIRLPTITMSTFSRAVSARPSTSLPTCSVIRPVGTAGVHVKFTGTSVVTPVSMSTIFKRSIDW